MLTLIRELWAISETEKWQDEVKPKLQISLSFKHELKSTCYGLNHVPPQNSNVETLISKVTVFGDRVFKKVIKVKRDHRSGAWCPYKKKSHQSSLSLSLHPRRKGHVSTQWESTICKPRRYVSTETNPSGTLILDF